jgi:lysophospholipase L1-like esterase
VDRPHLIRSRFTRFIVVIAAASIAGVLGMIAIETWVRSSWDESRGTPGFFISDPVRGQRLASNYDGWFAGVPAHTNSLGFRDTREYPLSKAPGTFRILVLGDSVTFGHGALYETSYPYLLEQRLRAWRPELKWEIWNLGVPGYNTAQELAYLKQVGERYAPDLVIVGFFQNDFTGFEPKMNAGFIRRATSAVIRTLQRHVYSTEFYRSLYLTLRFRLTESKENQQRLEHLATEDALLGRPNADQAAEQKPGGFERVSEEAVKSLDCSHMGPQSPPGLSAEIRSRAPSLASWFTAIEGFQSLHRAGKYRIVFFINMAPNECTGADRFVDFGTGRDNDALLEVLGRGTPAVSAWREFLYYRPSQMPAAAGHSLGNANLVKAQVLFDFLRGSVLPPLVPAGVAP